MSVTLAADMHSDVVGELDHKTVIDMDGESAGDVAVRLWMLTSVAVGKNGVTRVGDMDGDDGGKIQRQCCL